MKTSTRACSKVVVMGLGYIGLPTAALLASHGFSVLGVDINPLVVDTVSQGKLHIIEPALEEMVYTAIKAGYLRASLVPETADVFILAVPTPLLEQKADLRHIKAACEAIAPFLKANNLLLLESTSPVGTTAQVAQWLREVRPDWQSTSIHIAYCPERVLPGRILQELINNDRIIGGLTPTASFYAREFYQSFVKGECIVTDAATAEMCKLVENAFRDVNIAFANELSMICDTIHLNVFEVIRLANRHPRVNILHPGPGVGGHCIAIDPWFIVQSAPSTAKLIRQSREVNEAKSIWVLQKIQKAIETIPKDPQNITITLLGLTFKADIDDLRESPAFAIAKSLSTSHLGPLLIVEPYLTHLPSSLQETASLCQATAALQRSDIAVLLVDHQAFQDLPPALLARQILIDTKGIYT